MWKNKFRKMPLQAKLVMVFIVTSAILLLVNIFMFYNVNTIVNQLDHIYSSNLDLNQLEETLKGVQDNMTDYLNTKSTDAIKEYYGNEKNLQTMIEGLNSKAANNDIALMEKNIKSLTESYLKLTSQTIEAKRGRNVEKYKMYYEEATELYTYICEYVYSLNREQFKNNSENYAMLSFSLNYLELISTFILIVVAIANVILVVMVTKTITNPLKKLAAVANQIENGNFDVELLQVDTMDEVGIVSNAFNKMVVSIRSYINRIKENMKRERAMKEKELLMEAHLKDAKLKYLQAQINPHFLFNTLNAGAQLAMMEGADRTYEYVQNVAELFRYNVKTNNDIVTLEEEIKLVDIYIYILNVRFSGEIHFEKKLDDSLLQTMVPSMVLQPIVENCVNYGIRNISWQGLITLCVYEKEERVCISIKDNGIGMTKERIEKVMKGQLKKEDLSQDSNGIGLDNVIARLRLFCGREDVFEMICEGENKGTEVILYLPAIEREL